MCDVSTPFVYVVGMVLAHGLLVLETSNFSCSFISICEPVKEQYLSNCVQYCLNIS